MDQTYCMKCMQPNEGTNMCPHCGYVAGEALPASHVLRPGTILKDQYLLGEPLGQGGFGITYIGRDLNLDIRVAVKEYFPSGYAMRNTEASDQVTITDERLRDDVQKGKERFLLEAQTLAQFKNTPGIVDVLNFFMANNTAYIVMEYIAHPVLKLYLQEVKRIPERQAVTYACSILSALEKLHAHGIIHRDISPDNIFVVSPEGVKIFDFGAALLTKEGSEYDPEVVVKAGYAPPEQYSHKGRHDASTDVYAAGAVLYVMLTGEKPPESLERNLEDTLVMPSAMGITVSEAVEKALKKALMLRQADRFQTAADFRKALEEGMEKTSKQPAPEEGDRKERRRWRWR